MARSCWTCIEHASSSLLQAHGWLAAIGWGVLVPAGIVMARRWGQMQDGQAPTCMWWAAVRKPLP